MRFELVDQVIERSEGRIVTVKHVTSAEEYLADHFPSFPVLPGVLMIESMVQAARRLATAIDPAKSRHVLASVKALKYGHLVRPGDTLQVEVTLEKADSEGRLEFKGLGTVIRQGASGGSGDAPTAVSGKFSLRPLNPA
ncbi:MAG: beta-hydroxyacyl-ACP dehydratase [Planctomycetes bacterium]|nr:beta-hydroxyacyl-ACP dehydratase [Planctomycetota bacterium]